jgi:hypothetical protein
MCWIAAVPYVIAAVAAAGSAAAVVQNNKTVQAQLTGAANAKKADYNAIAAQRQEIDVQTTHASLAVQAEANRARATLRVAQGESGLVGPTQLRELASLNNATGENLATIEANRATANAQVERNLVNVDINAAGRMADANSRAIGNFAAGLQIGGAGLQGYTAGKGFTDTVSPTKAAPNVGAGGSWRSGR